MASAMLTTSLTTRELAKILKEGSVDLRYIEEEDFDLTLWRINWCWCYLRCYRCA